MEAPNNLSLDFDRLGNVSIPLRAILSYLNVHDRINFASTNTIIRDHAIRESRTLANIDRFGRFNLDLFPDTVSKEEIDAVHRVFPRVTKLRINLFYAEDHLLDELRKFEYLIKLSVYLTDEDTNYNSVGTHIRAVTCRANYFHSNHDAIFNFLRQIRGTKSISLYNGEITLPTQLLIETRDLETLKIHNSIITKPARLTEYLNRSTNLTYLKLTAENCLVSPYPIMVATNFINNILPRNRSNLTRLCFTLDQNRNASYQNLKLLRNLNKLEVYYSAQIKGLNLDKLINIASSLIGVETTFIEYLEKYKIFNNQTLEDATRKSYFYKNVIESKRMIVKSLDYTQVRRELQFIE